MFNTSQVLLRNRQFITEVPTLWLQPPADSLLQELPRPGLAHTWDLQVAHQLQRFLKDGSETLPKLEFQPLPSQEQRFSQIVLFMPKSQLELNLLWQMACALAAPQAVLYLVGEKREGVESAAKRLQKSGQPMMKLDSARHCQLWRIERLPSVEFPKLEDWEQRHRVSLQQQELDVVSLPGVFGAGRLDEGTALLLQHLGEVPNGRLLDFGCGAGVIGALLKSLQPKAQLTLVDVHAMALESARRTLAAKGLSADVQASDGLSQVEGKYRAIYSNPPFHTGTRTDYRITLQMIRDAYQHLEKGGELRLVANAFLPYPELIEEVFGQCETLAETSRFRIYRAQRNQ